MSELNQFERRNRLKKARRYADLFQSAFLPGSVVPRVTKDWWQEIAKASGLHVPHSQKTVQKIAAVMAGRASIEGRVRDQKGRFV